MNRPRALLLALFLLATAGAVAILAGSGRPKRTPTPPANAPATAPAPSSNGGTADGAADPQLAPAYAPADLFSEDPDRALAAAATLDPSTLTLAELRRQQGLLAAHPAAYYRARSSWGIGNRELPVLFRETAKAGTVWTDDTPGDLGDTHRSFSPDSMATLVEAMAVADTGSFPAFLSYLKAMAETTSGAKRTAARGFLYALARRREAAHGRPPPPLDSIRLGKGDGGYPAGFVTLARAAWLDPSPDEAAVPADLFLLRLGRELSPGPADEAFLVDLARHGRTPEARAFATAALARLPGDAAEAVIREIAAGEDVAAAIAAYALATRGEPTRLRELAALPDTGPGDAWPGRPEVAAVLRLHAFPEEGVEAWKETVEAASRAGPDEPEPPGTLWLDPQDRADMEGHWGVRLTAADLDAMAAALAGADVSAGRVLSFYGRIWPDGLGGPAIDRVVAALPVQVKAWGNLSDLADLLARLEVRAPEKLRALLRGWAESGGGEVREQAYLYLGRLGGETSDPGRMEDLEREAAGADPERAWSALLEIGERMGLPPSLTSPHWFLPDEQTVAEFRRRLLADDPAGAAIALGGPLTQLGRVDDERVLAFLRERQKDCSVYWEATGGLALAGDPDARAEIVGLVRDARTGLLESIDDPGLLTLDGDPELVELWISRVDANCCHGLLALYVLKNTFPLLDVDYIPYDMAEVRARIERWWARHRGSFVWSRLVDGWVAR